MHPKVLTKSNILKKFLLLIVWVVSFSGSEKTEWYIEFYKDEDTIHKIGRDHYLEAIELLEGVEDEKFGKQYYNLMYNESLYFTENYSYYECKTIPIFDY